MTTVTGMPRRPAAYDSDSAWLPEEWVATPRPAVSSSSPNTALQAPRTLNAPAFWKFSHLKNNVAPVSSSMYSDVRTGVRWMYGSIRRCAATTSS